MTIGPPESPWQASAAPINSSTIGVVFKYKNIKLLLLLSQSNFLPNDNFPRGNFPNVQFPKRQVPKGKVWLSEAPQAAMGPEHCDGGGAEVPWSPQKWPPSLRICRITSRPRKTGLPAPVTSYGLPPFCLHAPHFGSNKKYLAFIIYLASAPTPSHCSQDGLGGQAPRLEQNGGRALRLG